VRALADFDPAATVRVSQQGEVFLPGGQLNVANCSALSLFVACPISPYQPAVLDDDLPEQSLRIVISRRDMLVNSRPFTARSEGAMSWISFTPFSVSVTFLARASSGSGSFLSSCAFTSLPTP
jgi:hypothetical protein